MKVSQNGWFVIEHPFKVGDLGVPPFQETPLFYIKIAVSGVDSIFKHTHFSDWWIRIITGLKLGL